MTSMFPAQMVEGMVLLLKKIKIIKKKSGRVEGNECKQGCIECEVPDTGLPCANGQVAHCTIPESTNHVVCWKSQT